MKIDVHAHLFPQEYYAEVQRLGMPFEIITDPLGQRILRHKGARLQRISPLNSDVDERLKAMDEAGVDIQVLSLSSPNVYYTDDDNSLTLARMVNDRLSQAARQHPDRLMTFASVPMGNADYAIQELHRAIDDLGMNGVILGTNIAGKPLNSPEFLPFYAEANRMRLTIFLHPMPPVGIEAMGEYGLAPLIGFVFDTTLAVTRMIYSGIFEKFPDIRLIIPHLGGAVLFFLERIENGYYAMAECRAHLSQPPSVYLKRLYYDTISFHKPALLCAYQTVGADHLVLGSDYPHVIDSISRSIESVKDLGLASDEEEKIFSQNALALLKR